MILRLVLVTAIIGTTLLTQAVTSEPRQVTAPERRALLIDADQLLQDVKVLSADSMEGRKADTPGNAKAREYIVKRFKESGLKPFGSSYLQPFTFSYRNESAVRQGANVVGYLAGKTNPNLYLVVSAHYDHLGIQGGQIFNGADDNASGVAAVLALSKHFSATALAHSMIFVAFDDEEGSGAGARTFVSDPPVKIASIVMNVNLDMVSTNHRNELYAAGTYHYPFLKPYLDQIAARAPIRLLFGHDKPDPPKDDWTSQSDHRAFHRQKIPFVYFGVEDHPNYHKPTDDSENITSEFFIRVVETILASLKLFDANLTVIEKQKNSERSLVGDEMATDIELKKPTTVSSHLTTVRRKYHHSSSIAFELRRTYEL